MTRLFTVEQNIIRMRALTVEDFEISKWHIPTVSDIKTYMRHVEGTCYIKLKPELVKEIQETWEPSNLWSDWRISKTGNDNEVGFHANTQSINVCFKGCKEERKTRKAEEVVKAVATMIDASGQNYILDAIAEFKKYTVSKIEQHNRWTITRAVDTYAKNDLSAYPKLENIPGRKELVDEINSLKEAVHQKRIALQKMDRQYVLSIWDSTDSQKFPDEIRKPVIEQLQKDLATLDNGHEVGRDFPF